MADEFEKRERQLKTALERAEQGGSAARKANAMDHLAMHYHSHRQYEPAAQMYLRAIAQWRHILGADHPVVATQLINLGQVQSALSEFSAAATAFNEALGIIENNIEFDDIEAVAALQRFAQTLQRQGDRKTAYDFLQRVAAVVAQVNAVVRV